jgi:hypothetical protein
MERVNFLSNSILGVTIPSQIRYVNYYEKCLKNGFPKLDKKLNLIKITFNTIPATSPGGSTPTFQISLLKNEIYDWSVKRCFVLIF